MTRFLSAPRERQRSSEVKVIDDQVSGIHHNQTNNGINQPGHSGAFAFCDQKSRPGHKANDNDIDDADEIGDGVIDPAFQGALCEGRMGDKDVRSYRFCCR